MAWHSPLDALHIRSYHANPTCVAERTGGARGARRRVGVGGEVSRDTREAPGRVAKHATAAFCASQRHASPCSTCPCRTASQGEVDRHSQARNPSHGGCCQGIVDLTADLSSDHHRLIITCTSTLSSTAVVTARHRIQLSTPPTAHHQHYTAASTPAPVQRRPKWRRRLFLPVAVRFSTVPLPRPSVAGELSPWGVHCAFVLSMLGLSCVQPCPRWHRACAVGDVSRAPGADGCSLAGEVDDDERCGRRAR